MSVRINFWLFWVPFESCKSKEPQIWTAVSLTFLQQNVFPAFSFSCLFLRERFFYDLYISAFNPVSKILSYFWLKLNTGKSATGFLLWCGSWNWRTTYIGEKNSLWLGSFKKWFGHSHLDVVTYWTIHFISKFLIKLDSQFYVIMWCWGLNWMRYVSWLWDTLKVYCNFNIFSNKSPQEIYVFSNITQ